MHNALRDTCENSNFSPVADVLNRLFTVFDR